MAKITVDFDLEPDALEFDLEQAFDAANDAFGTDAATEIQASKWAWPNETYRYNGDVVLSSRDIVDTGDLLLFYKQIIESTRSHSHVWDVDYSLEVHEGITLMSGRVRPARPFTRLPLEKVMGNFAKAFKRAS